MQNIRAYLAAVLFALLIAPAAHATIINFGSENFATRTDGYTFIDSGFQFVYSNPSGSGVEIVTANPICLPTSCNSPGGGLHALYEFPGSTSVTMTRVGGGDFSLSSILVAPPVSTPAGLFTFITGQTAAGGTVLNSVMDPPGGGFFTRNFAFPFSDLTSVTFPGGVVGLAVTNINVAPIGHSISDIVSGAVKLSSSGNEMDASFTPNFGLTLAQAAAAGGFDHFNWVQNIWNYPGTLPYTQGTPCLTYLFHPGDFDPPIGGTTCMPADNLPFYWDEGSDPRLLAGYHLADNIFGNTLNFSDIPGDPFLNPLSTGDMSFVTSLVGVNTDDSWVPLFTFDWHSNYNPTPLIGGGGVSIGETRNITPSTTGQGGVYGVQELPSPTDVPSEVVNNWVNNGAKISVPEPSSFLYFAAGICVMFFLSLFSVSSWRKRL